MMMLVCMVIFLSADRLQILLNAHKTRIYTMIFFVYVQVYIIYIYSNSQMRFKHMWKWKSFT